MDVLTDERTPCANLPPWWHVTVAMMGRCCVGSKPRTAVPAWCMPGDATGKVLEVDVSAMVRDNPRIHVLEHAFLSDLIVRDGPYRRRAAGGA